MLNPIKKFENTFRKKFRFYENIWPFLKKIIAYFKSIFRDLNLYK